MANTIKQTELRKAFNLNRGQAKKLHNLLFAAVPDDADTRPGFEYEWRLEQVSEFLGFHGVEGITPDGEVYPKASYANNGDTYKPTIVWDCDREQFFCCGWGDWLAEWEAENLTDEDNDDDEDDDDEEKGDDLCDMCMSSEVHVDRTTYCGKTIGIECGCEETCDGTCGDDDCTECAKNTIDVSLKRVLSAINDAGDGETLESAADKLEAMSDVEIGHITLDIASTKEVLTKKLEELTGVLGGSEFLAHLPLDE